MSYRFDAFWIGILVGIFLPALALLMFYYSTFEHVPFGYFFTYMQKITVLPKLISLCALPNLALFFLFLSRNHYKSSKGVVIATMILTIVVLVLKIFF